MKVFNYLAIIFFCWAILVLLGFGFLVIPFCLTEYVREIAISMPIAIVMGAFSVVLSKPED